VRKKRSRQNTISPEKSTAVRGRKEYPSATMENVFFAEGLNTTLPCAWGTLTLIVSPFLYLEITLKMIYTKIYIIFKWRA
jgi:hypothetical protein